MNSSTAVNSSERVDEAGTRYGHASLALCTDASEPQYTGVVAALRRDRRLRIRLNPCPCSFAHHQVKSTAVKGQTWWAKLCCSTAMSRTGGLLNLLRINVAAAGAGGGLVEEARALREHDGLQLLWGAASRGPKFCIEFVRCPKFKLFR